MERTTSRLKTWLTAGALAVSLAAVPLGTAEARMGGMGGGGWHGGGGGMPWMHGGGGMGGWHGGGGGWHGGGWHGGGWHGGGWGWRGGYGRYGYGWGPFYGGLAAGALLTAPYAYGYGNGYYDDDYGYGSCRVVLVPRGGPYHRFYVRRTVCY